MLNPMLLQSPLLAPVRHVWRALRRIPWVKRRLDLWFLYPKLPHITRRESYPSGPLLIAGFFTSVHGIGEAARLELAAQRASDANVVGVDISPAFGLCEMPAPDGVVPLAQAPKHGPLLLHCNAPETGRALQFLGEELTRERHITGYWAWELETPPRDWERAYGYLDALWVLSVHTAKAFSCAPIPVAVHHPVVRDIPDGGHSYEDLGLPDLCSKTVFLSMADGRSDLMRKNIAGVVRAFGKACGNNGSAALVVKLHHTDVSGPQLQKVRDLCAAHANVHLLETFFSSAQRNSLLHRVQAVISLHRAEGYGLMLAEAKVLGKRIISTAYSAPMDFLDESTATLVPFSLVAVRGDTANYNGYAHARWAEPNENAAAEAVLITLKQCTAG